MHTILIIFEYNYYIQNDTYITNNIVNDWKYLYEFIQVEYEFIQVYKYEILVYNYYIQK